MWVPADTLLVVHDRSSTRHVLNWEFGRRSITGELITSVLAEKGVLGPLLILLELVVLVVVILKLALVVDPEF